MNSPLSMKEPLITSDRSEHFPNTESEFVSYRVVSKSAIACFVFAILSLASYLNEVFVIFPIVTLAIGFVSWLGFRRFGDELIGKRLMQIGMVIGAFCLVSSGAYHIYVYNTEVPENYQRISFAMLRENPRKGLTYNEVAAKLDGKKVFLRGYVRPGDKKKNLKQFILVGDFGSCCFGGNPKISEVIAVNIVIPDKTVNYGYGLRRIGGTFRFIKETATTFDKEVPFVHYYIEADHVK
jgi:hypothetical protein